MFNLSLALAFALSALFSPGGRLLGLFVDRAVLRGAPPYQGHLLSAFANYWIVALFLYVVLRWARAGRWLRPTGGIHALIGLGNALLILYVLARVLASTVEGGGASFMVMSLSAYVVVPAWSLFAIGFIWLAIRSFGQRHAPAPEVREFGRGALAIVLLLLAAPSAALYYVFAMKENAPFRLHREAGRLFEEKCVGAGEQIFSVPEGVEGVYLDPDGGAYFDRVTDGKHAGYGGGIIGQPLLSGGFLRYFEAKNHWNKSSEEPFRRFGGGDRMGEPVNAVNSEYAVFQHDLVDAAEASRLGVSGKVVVVTHLRTGEVIATLRYVASRRHLRVCGHSGNGNFSVSGFIRKALNLKANTYSP